VLKLCLAATCFIFGALGSAVVAPGAHVLPFQVVAR